MTIIPLDECSAADEPAADSGCHPYTRAPAVRLKPGRRWLRCTCGRSGPQPRQADKRWRCNGAPCLIRRREKVPC